MHIFRPQCYESLSQPQQKIWEDHNTWRLKNILLKNKWVGAPGWLSWLSIQLLISVQVMISPSWDGAPGCALCWAWSLLKILFLCPSPACTYALSHSLSKEKKKLVDNLLRSRAISGVSISSLGEIYLLPPILKICLNSFSDTTHSSYVFIFQLIQ